VKRRTKRELRLWFSIIGHGWSRVTARCLIPANAVSHRTYLDILSCWMSKKTHAMKVLAEVLLA